MNTPKKGESSDIQVEIKKAVLREKSRSVASPALSRSRQQDAAKTEWF